MEEAFVALPKGSTILAERRRWHWRVPEPGMVVEHGWTALGDVVPSGFKAVVDTLLVDSTG